MTRIPGKKVGSKIYVHRQYAELFVPTRLLIKAARAAPRSVGTFDCVRYDKNTGIIAFQWSKDFNTADEPSVNRTVRVLPGGDVKYSEDMGQIWHHKWMWVADDYDGFDVEASKKRSELWAPHVSKEELRKIGYRHIWDTLRPRWERS